MILKEVYNSVRDLLSSAEIESADFEARILVSELLGLSLSDLFIRFNEEIDDETYERLMSCCRRRVQGEPLQYIIGKWDFMGRTYKVGDGVLIPRPETELLCEKIIDTLRHKKEAVVYDLCSGSGCIGITLKKECPYTDIYLVEKSQKALGYLMQNASELMKDTFYTIVKGDVLKLELFEEYPAADIIVSNPPYIKSKEVPLLQKEVTFEPAMALDGGEDGLVFYRYIISEWSKKLKADGEIFFEIGEDQGQAVSNMFFDIGFDSRVIKDYNNHDRIVKGRKKAYNDI